VCSPLWKKVFVVAPLLAFLGAVPTDAQVPLAAGKSLAFDSSLGYAYTRMEVPGTGRIGMGGPKATFTADFLPRVGIRADVAYQRSQPVFGSGHHNDALTYMGGPVFYVMRRRHTVAYLEGLFGGARLNGVNIWQYGGYLTGFVNKTAWTAGVGAQHTITPSVSLRLQANYLRTTFFDQTGAFKGSGSPSASLTVVYSFGRGYRR
jgi:opacity protein-like surface antigen